jgi:hypothetical protein
MHALCNGSCADCLSSRPLARRVGEILLRNFGQTRSNIRVDLGCTGVGLLSLAGVVVDAASAYTYAQTEGNKLALSAFHINRISVHTFLGDHNQAIKEAKKARDFAQYADYRRSFYEGLAAFAAARSATGRSRRKPLSVANKALRETQTWASKGSPNFHNMVALLQAELAAIREKVQAALWLFDKSIIRKDLFTRKDWHTNAWPDIINSLEMTILQSRG